MSNPLFDTINAIFNKDTQFIEQLKIEDSLNIFLNKWLSYDANNCKKIRPLMQYLFFISPTHYFYLLYLSFRKSRPPFLKKPTEIKQEKYDEELLNKLKYILNWSDLELQKNFKVVKEFILTNEKEWKKELGVK